MKETNISVDAIFLTIQQVHWVLWETFPFRLAKLMQHYNLLTDLNNKILLVCYV